MYFITEKLTVILCPTVYTLTLVFQGHGTLTGDLCYNSILLEYGFFSITLLIVIVPSAHVFSHSEMFLYNWLIGLNLCGVNLCSYFGLEVNEV